MDLNPSFGRKELMETLSQTSGGSRSNNNRGENSCSGSRGSQNKPLLHHLPMDEAVRRLGRRLSIQAHGDVVYSSPTKLPLRLSEHSCFHVNEKNDDRRRTSDNHHHEQLHPRTAKVAKTGYSDHGEHQYQRKMNFVRKLTIECKDTYQKCQDYYDDEADAISSNEFSPHNYSFSKLALDSETTHNNNNNRHSFSFDEKPGRWNKRSSNNNKGLLSAVLESQHSDSNTSASQHQHNNDRSSHASPMSQSISTKDSRTVTSSAGQHGAASVASQPRGKCLTVPSEGVANNGLDNNEGNLIVFENDTIVVPRKNLRMMKKQNVRSAEFRIQDMQGQGTFAQVFQCLHVQTGKLVALKIVKNKPAYTRQAAIEIDIFQTLQDKEKKRDYMVNLISYFMHQNHLCLVFELLGMNLYEILKRRQFRGLPLHIVRDIVRQAVDGIKDLSQKNVVHCDLKPENMLFDDDETSRQVIAIGSKRRDAQSTMRSSTGSKTDSISGNNSRAASSSSTTIIANSNMPPPPPPTPCKLKLIDFGSACFEGHTAHSYIQSRFYRSPEVLVGVPYDSSIDMWSLGCVAAELFLGLPILPGVHEHDQLCRIAEMIGKIPDWMLDQGSKATKYCIKFVPRASPGQPPSPGGRHNASLDSPPLLPQWRIKTQEEYVASLSQSEMRKKGGIDKLSKPPGNRYFKRKKLSDILVLHAQNSTGEDRGLVPAFVHFLYGILDPDPWKRFTAFQAAQHPFLTGNFHLLHAKSDETKVNLQDENLANAQLDFYWPQPWDPAICRRKLLNVQKIREKEQANRRGHSSRHLGHGRTLGDTTSPGSSNQVGDTPVSFGRASGQIHTDGGRTSPPNQISSSASTTSSQQQLIIGVSDTFGGQAAQTNWNTQSQPATPQQFGPMFGQGVASNRSFQGDASFTGSETNFAYALERPGVIPVVNAFGNSVASQSTAASLQSVSTQNTSQGPMQGMQFGHHHHGRQPLHGYNNNDRVAQATPWTFDQMLVNPHSLVSAAGRHDGGFQSVFPSQATVASDTSSVAMSEVTFVDPNLVLMQQQQQWTFLQQQQQQQQMMQMPFQQVAGFQQPAQFGAPYQQQPLQMAMQQQQPTAVVAPGGGIYYVATSATGQPIILQPVGLWNQSGGQALTQQQAPNQMAFVQPSQGFLPQQQQHFVQSQQPISAPNTGQQSFSSSSQHLQQQYPHGNSQPQRQPRRSGASM